MANLKPAYSPDEIKKMGVANVRSAYNDLATTYNRILNGNLYYCHYCNDFHNQESFYSDKRYASGLFPDCKKKLLYEATDYDPKTKTFSDNKKKTIEVFRKLDLPFIESVYSSALTTTQAEVGEKNRQTAYQHMLTIIKSLPQYKGQHFENSEFGADYETEDEVNENSRLLKSAKKRFGKDYPIQDLIALETEYQDWVKRYPCENKAQETLYKNLCFVQLNIEKAQKSGKDTKDLLKTQQDIMASLQIKPSQSNANALTEAKTFGQLIEKWEDEWDGGKPIPEVDPDFADVDKIGLYIDVFFRGHLAKMMGLKGGLSHLYDKFISKYTVSKPQYDEDTESEAIFDQIFGRQDNEL